MEEEEELDNSQNTESKGVISESDLLDIYDTHYYDLFPKILKIDEDKFFSLLQEQVLLTLRIINKLSDLSLMSFFQDLISERYKADKIKITTDLEKIKTLPENEITYLDYSNCFIHCHKNLDCFHKCSNKLILYEGFIYCLNCKKAYNESQIKLYCKECNKSYYSKLRENVEETNKFLIPTVFSHPHCEPDNDENGIIKCLECGDDLYFDLSKVKDKKNKPKKLSDTIKDLVCPNCKLIYDTTEISFICPECDEEFTSNAMLFNGFSIQKKRILFLVHTLMKQIVALPDNYDEKKCKCDINTFKEFTHIDDNGLLIKGYKDEGKIVCKECFEIFENNNFEWKCPSCGEVFKSKKIESKDINENEIKNEDNQNENNEDKNNEDEVENNEDEDYEENDNENIIRDNSEDEKNIENNNENEDVNNNENLDENNNDIDNKNDNDIDNENEDENENENENNEEIEAEDENANNNEVEAGEGNENENEDIKNEELEEEEEIKENIKEIKNKEIKKEEIKKDDKKEEVKKEVIKKEDNKKEIIKKEVIRKEVIKKQDNKKEDNKNERKIIIINNSKEKKETDYKKYNNYKNNSSNNNKVYANYKRNENKIEEKKENNYKYKVDLSKYKLNSNNNKIKNQNNIINNKENIDKNRYNTNIKKTENKSNAIQRSDKKVNHNYVNIQNINNNNYNESKYEYKKQYSKEIIKNYKNDKEKEPQKIYKNVSSKYIYDSKKNNNSNISANYINRNNNDIQKRTEYINNNNIIKNSNINSRQNHQIININESNKNNDKNKKYIINEESKKDVKIIKKDIKDKEKDNINKGKENINKENEIKNRQNKSKENIIRGNKSIDNKSRENKSKDNKNKVIKFKNIQKYFEDFNEEYVKENEEKNKLKEKIKNKHKNLRESEKEDKKPIKYNINKVHIINNVSSNDVNNFKKENKIYINTDSNNNSNKNNVHIISQFNSKKDNIIIKKDNEGNLPENKAINSSNNLPKRQSYIKSNNSKNENKSNNVQNEPKKQDNALNDKVHKNDLNQKIIYIKNDKNKKKDNENEDKQKNIIKQQLENKNDSNNEEKNIINSNNYKNLKILGHGSYGKIYLVEDIKTKAKYAMKKLIIGDSLELKDNQDEYNMIMKITELYPELNIIHVVGTETKKFDDYNYVFYVLMEVANCDWEKELMNRAKNKAYYTEEELFFILESLVDTFSYLQQIGICHRDIKPQNILCFGEKGYKISDFGEAKYRKKWRLQQSEIEYTAMQTIRGTELYMSPILYVALKTAPNKGANHNVFKSDVFSLGMCFLFASCLDYKCLYSVRRATDINKLRAVIEQYVNKRYSQYFIDILLCMLHLNEKERPDFIELSAMV